MKTKHFDFYDRKKSKSPKVNRYFVKSEVFGALLAYRDYDTVDGYRYSFVIGSGLGSQTENKDIAKKWIEEASLILNAKLVLVKV